MDNQNYPLPIGQPETVSSDAYNLEYQYEIPTVERINIVDSTLSAPDLSFFGDSINFIFTISHDIFDDLGIMPLVLACFSLSAVGYALWKIGADIMLSTVLQVGAIVAIIGGVAYFFFQYMPVIVEFWNQVSVVYWQLSSWIPDYLQPFIAVSLLLCGIGLLVKLL